jgi:hypothetical protein
MSLLEDASLIVTPNAYKEGKLYSIIPTNGNGDFSVTRATTATRVNSAGLVELVPYNLVQYSEDFSQGVWGKVRFSATANTTTAPDGTLTADTISMTQVGSLFRAITQVVSGSTLTYTASVYFKYIDRQYIQFTFDGTFGGSQRVNIDLLNGVITDNSMNGGSTLTSVGDGWYKLTATSTGTNTQPNFSIWAIDTETAARAVLSTGTGSTFIWGAQINEGTSALDYQATETRLNIPRLDYSLGSCPNILLEPQRTNLTLWSEQFDNAYFNRVASSVTANSTTSPSGIVNADTLVENTSTNFHLLARSGFPSGTNTLSVYAKASTRNFIYIAFFNGTDFGAYFNLSNGTIGTIDAGVTATIQDAGYGWYRCSVTFTSLINVSLSLGIAQSNGVRSYTGNGTGSVFLWGAQLEAGAYATSYIPTTSASVTRNLDVVQKTGVSSLIGQTEGTLYWEGTLTDGQRDDIFYLNTSLTNSVFIYKPTINNTILFRVYYGGSPITISTATAYTGLVKIAAAYKNGDSVMYINGVQVGTSATSFAFTGALNDVVLNNTAYLFGNATKNIKTAALFPTRLTNAQLAALTA